jgi:prevent-host-death family protein
MPTVNVYEAKTHLSRLLALALAGEEVVIARAGKPVARLVPLEGPRRSREPGLFRGRIRFSEDVEEPLPADVIEAFYR